MARYDFRTPRLYVEAPLAPGAKIALKPDQTHYLLNVLRLRPHNAVLAFNGRDGEWRCVVANSGKRAVNLIAETQTQSQTGATDLHYWFAPLKHARLDYMVQKAVELGVSRLQPVITRHTQVARVNIERMRANAIEAAEQCGILTLPEVGEPLDLERAVRQLDPDRLLVFCDEGAEQPDPLAALTSIHENKGSTSVAVLIGPEGGFAEEERSALLLRPNVVRLLLGPRIMRADTAAVAALSLVQAALGDWR
jgi:16S rRNA (uracil1498-N3)-methyltransferase